MMLVTLTVFLVALSTETLAAGGDCVNSITFKPIGSLTYSLGSDALKNVNVEKSKFTCYDLDEYVSSSQVMWDDLSTMIKTALSKQYLPTINAFANDDSQDGQGCYDTEGQYYCCPGGIKNFSIDKIKACNLNDGEKVKAGPYKITASGDPQGNSKGYTKMAAVITYVCNEQARRRTVSLRFNGKVNGKCKVF